MSRHKEIWTGHLAGKPEQGGRVGRVVLPVELDKEDGREVKINIPVSRIPALVQQLEKAYDTGIALKRWADTEE